MQRRVLLGGGVFLCAVISLTGCSTNKVNMEGMPPAPSATSMTVQELLDDPYVQSVDKVFNETIRGEELAVEGAFRSPSQDSALNEYGYWKNSERQMLWHLSYFGGADLNKRWLTEGNILCEHPGYAGLENDQVMIEDGEEVFVNEKPWLCSEPGYDFFPQELNELSSISPLSILAAQENSDLVKTQFADGHAELTFSEKEEGYSQISWAVSADGIEVRILYPEGENTIVEVYPFAPDMSSSVAELNRVTAVPPLTPSRVQVPSLLNRP